MSASRGDGTDRLDPVLLPLAKIARVNLATEMLAATRISLNERRRESAATLDNGEVRTNDITVSGADGHSIPVRVYTPSKPLGPGVVYCHSGAFVLGNLDTEHRLCIELARTVGCVIVSVDYRLAPENPFPHGFNDAAAVLTWFAANAQELSVDSRRIAVAGHSAGACLAAGLAHRSADGELPPVVYQLLHQPVLDDLSTGSKRDFTSTPGFDGPGAAMMWDYYLAYEPPSDRAVPARRQDLSGVADAFIGCAAVDPLRDEAIAYAAAMVNAGCGVGLHMVAGACHGFDSLLPQWEESRRLTGIYSAALSRAFFG